MHRWQGKASIHWPFREVFCSSLIAFQLRGLRGHFNRVLKNRSHHWDWSHIKVRLASDGRLWPMRDISKQIEFCNSPVVLWSLLLTISCFILTNTWKNQSTVTYFYWNSALIPITSLQLFPSSRVPHNCSTDSFSYHHFSSPQLRFLFHTSLFHFTNDVKYFCFPFIDIRKPFSLSASLLEVITFLLYFAF